MLFEIPEVEMPFPARMHPHVDRIRERTRTWIRDRGLLNLGVWDEAGFEAADFGLFTALTHPRASADQLGLVTDWHNWSWFIDDYFVETFKRTKNVVGAKAFVERVKALMPVAGSTPPPPVGPVEEALAELWSRTLPIMPQEMLAPFSRLVADLYDSSLWEMHNDVQGRIPDPVDFIEMRRKTVGGEFEATLAQFGAGAALPAELRDTRQIKAIVDIFGDVMGLHNDLVSFEKDVAGEGTVNNAVLAVRNFFGGELQDAANVVGDLISARLREFQELADEVPAAADYLDELRSWLAGYFHWADRTGRYRVSAAPQRISWHHPSGLGTAALLVR